MDITEITSKELHRELKIHIPNNDIEAKLVLKLEDLKNTVQLKGFRQGKVPLTHLRKVFGGRLMPEIIDEIIKESSTNALSERKEVPAFQPKISFLAKGGDDEKEKEIIDKIISHEKELDYWMSYEVIPLIETPKFNSLKLNKKIAKVTEEDIKEALDRIGEENKSFENRKIDESATQGDQVTIDFIGRIDGEPFEGGAANDAPLIIGSGAFIPGFEEQLVDAKINTDIQIKVNFPDDYQVEHLAGKPAVFETKVKKIEKPTKTKLDNAFAKKLGFDDLSKLKNEISSQLEKDYETISRSRLKKDLMDHLDKTLNYKLPPTLVNNETDLLWNNYLNDIKNSGKEIEDVAAKEKESKKEYNKIAERRVRLGLLFNKIAEDESIDASEDEVNKAIMEQARNYPGKESEVIKLYQNNPNAMLQVKSPLIEEKVVDHILNLVKIDKENITRAELIAHDHDHDHSHDHDHDHDHSHDHDHDHKNDSKGTAKKTKSSASTKKTKSKTSKTSVKKK